MAKKHSVKSMLFFGAVTAVAGGILAYRHRQDIDRIVGRVADSLSAEEEDGFFAVDLDGDGKPDAVAVDIDGDGEPDSIFADMSVEELSKEKEPPTT